MGEENGGGEPLRIGEDELQSRLADILRETSNGASFLVTSANEVVVAELRPPPRTVLYERRFGMMKGKIHMAPDFDDFPDDLIDIMEGRDE